jgi:hypothetical protein
MKKYNKSQKKEFVQTVRAMKEPKPTAKKAAPRSKRVPNADGPGGSLGGY